MANTLVSRRRELLAPSRRDAKGACKRLATDCERFADGDGFRGVVLCGFAPWREARPEELRHSLRIVSRRLPSLCRKAWEDHASAIVGIVGQRAHSELCREWCNVTMCEAEPGNELWLGAG